MSNIIRKVKRKYKLEIKSDIIKEEISLIFQRCILEKRWIIYGIS